ncbi:MAG: sigma factor [Acidimicrobiales bacterium]
MTSLTITAEQRAMVEKNLPLVEHIVSRLAARFASNYSREDLVQTGTIGLIEATCRFDPDRSGVLDLRRSPHRGLDHRHAAP